MRNVQAKAALATAEQKLNDANVMLRNVKEFSNTILSSCNLKSKRYNEENKERVKTIRLTDDLIVAIEGAINGGGESDFPNELLSVEKELQSHEGRKNYTKKFNGLDLAKDDSTKKYSAIQPGNQCTYIVKAGDHLQSIQQKFNIANEKDLRNANMNLENLFDTHLKIVYPPVGTYVVVPRKFIITKKLRKMCSKIQRAVENTTVPVNHFVLEDDEDIQDQTRNHTTLREGDEKHMEQNPFCHSKIIHEHNQFHKLITYGHEEFCGKHGICNKKSGLCECFPGWTGVFCRKPLCHEECELNGVCSKAGKCICTKDYFGRSCEKKFQHGKTRTVEMRNKDLANVTAAERKLVNQWDSAYDAWERHLKLEKMIKQRNYRADRVKYSKLMGKMISNRAKKLEQEADHLLRNGDNSHAMKDMEEVQQDTKKVDYFKKEEMKNLDSLTRVEDAMDLLRTAASETSLAARMGNYTNLELDFNHTDQLKQLIQYMYKSAVGRSHHSVETNKKFFKDLLNNNTMLKMKHMVDTASLKTKQAKNDYVWSKTRCPNDCSGNGNCTVVYSFELNANVGQCICSFGYGGVDCANEIDNRSPGDKLYDDILMLEKIGEKIDDAIALAKKKETFALGILNNKTKVWDLIQETNITKLKATYNDTKKKLNDALELVETRRLRLKHFEFTEFPQQIKDGKRNIRETIENERKKRLQEEQLKRKRVGKIITLRERYKKEGKKLPEFIGWEKYEEKGQKTQYYNTLTETNSYDMPKEGRYPAPCWRIQLYDDSLYIHIYTHTNES